MNYPFSQHHHPMEVPFKFGMSQTPRGCSFQPFHKPGIPGQQFEANKQQKSTAENGTGWTYFDRIPIGLGGIFGALKVNAVRGSSRFTGLAFASCGFTANGPATIPSPVSTRAWPLEPALDPSSGISFRAWKFRGLRPRTTIGAVVASVKTTLDPLVKVPITFKWRTKCCWSSFLRPLFAVALGEEDVSTAPNVTNLAYQLPHLHSEL